MANRLRFAVSGTGIIIGAILILAALAFFASGGDGGQGQGHMMDGDFSLTTTGWIVALVGVVTIVLSLVYLAIPRGERKERGVVPLYPELVVIDVKDKEGLRFEPEAQPPVQKPTTLQEDSGESVTYEQMALRLLEGDDRKVFRKILESGGEILQKDIVSSVPFSKAKVSRIIERLERKGLVTKERHGFTNKIRLAKYQ